MFGKRFLRTVNSTVGAVGAASAEIVSNLVAGKAYVFCSSTACWIKQGPTGTITASKASGSSFVGAGVEIDIHGSNGNSLAVIQDAAGGNASITPVDEI